MSTPKSVVPKLIDNKKKHLDRTLSARQRDALLLEEAKEDKSFRFTPTAYGNSSAFPPGVDIGHQKVAMQQTNNYMAMAGTIHSNHF